MSVSYPKERPDGHAVGSVPGRDEKTHRVSIGDVAGRRSRLEAEREEALDRLASLTNDFEAVVAASLDSNADDEHDPEGATIAFERSQIGSLARQVQRHIAEIDAALTRLETGTYGACEDCGRAIGVGRLEARPAARTCIRCAAATRR
jgi:RNA polymerase-binding protein DksA